MRRLQMGGSQGKNLGRFNVWKLERRKPWKNWLMAEIRTQLVGSLSHDLEGFCTCQVVVYDFSTINSMFWMAVPELCLLKQLPPGFCRKVALILRNTSRRILIKVKFVWKVAFQKTAQVTFNHPHPHYITGGRVVSPSLPCFSFKTTQQDKNTQQKKSTQKIETGWSWFTPPRMPVSNKGLGSDSVLNCNNSGGDCPK